MVRRLRPADRCRRADAARRYPVAGSSRVGAAHPAAALSGALVLVQATPGPVLLGTGNGVVEALDPDRAARADLLGLALPDVPLWLPLAVWAEEEHQILATTRGSVRHPQLGRGSTAVCLRTWDMDQSPQQSCLDLGLVLLCGPACTRVRSTTETAVASCNARRRHTVPARPK